MRGRWVTARELSAIKRMLAERRSTRDIARAINRSLSEFYRLLNRHGLRVAPEVKAMAVSVARRAHPRTMQPEDVAVLRAMYAANFRLDAIGAVLGWSRRVLSQRRGREGWPKMPHVPQIPKRTEGAELFAAVERLRFRGHIVRDIGAGLFHVDGEPLSDRQVMGRLQYSDRRMAA